MTTSEVAYESETRAAVVAQLEQELRSQCEGLDDGGAVLRGVHLCALHRMQMPDWLCSAFVQRYRRISDAEADSWDKVFGRPFPRGTRLATVRRRLEIRQRVHGAVWAILRDDPNRAIDIALFEDAGQRLGRGFACSGSTARRHYYEALQHGYVNLKDLRRESSESFFSGNWGHSGKDTARPGA